MAKTIYKVEGNSSDGLSPARRPRASDSFRPPAQTRDESASASSGRRRKLVLALIVIVVLIILMIVAVAVLGAAESPAVATSTPIGGVLGSTIC